MARNSERTSYELNWRTLSCRLGLKWRKTRAHHRSMSWLKASWRLRKRSSRKESTSLKKERMRNSSSRRCNAKRREMNKKSRRRRMRAKRVTSLFLNSNSFILVSRKQERVSRHSRMSLKWWRRRCWKLLKRKTQKSKKDSTSRSESF